MKLGPLARCVSCALVKGEDERLTTHLALMLLSAIVMPVLVDVVVVVWDVVEMLVVVVVVELSVGLLLFGCPQELPYIYLSKPSLSCMYLLLVATLLFI